MKFKDVRTLESVLTEYGMKPGTSTPTSQQQTGSNAKANAVKSPTVNKKTPPKKDLGSPTTTPGLDVKEPEQEQPKFTPIKAGEIEVDSEYKDEKGEVLGKVVSKVGDNPNPDKVVVQDPKGEYTLVDPQDEVYVDVEESKLGKLNKSSSSKLKLAKANKIKKKLKKLSRKFKLREQGEEAIFEINFNKKEIATSALNSAIKCGFEAETVWDNIYPDDEEEDWLYEYNWYDIEDFVRDQEGSSSVQNIEDAYEEFILDKASDDESDIIWEMVSEREEDEHYLNDYIEQEISEEDIEDYKERILDDLPEDQHDEYEDWDVLNWGRQYVEEEMLDEFREYLADEIRDSGEAMDRAVETVRDDYDMDHWATSEYGSWHSCLYEFDIYLSNPNSGGGVREVSEIIERWADKNSKFTDVEYGDYHSNYGSNNSFWRVETDSSIEASGGTGAEIISPVYKTPKAMLEEMKSLFEFFDNEGVETNSSTGLHVTMSIDSEEREEVNPVKLAVLLGDKYLLSTFGRERNSYAKSQMDLLQKRAAELKSNPDNVKNIKDIEKILSKGISRDKFSSINFKDQNDRDTNNQLIEFRIGGGDDYHREFETATKAVIRYATTLNASASDKLYSKDYSNALFRILRKIDELDPDTIERGKDERLDDPLIDALKDMFGKDHYLDTMDKLNAAFHYINEYEKLSQPDADKKWKQSIAQFKKDTGKDPSWMGEATEEREPLRGYLEPDRIAPSKRAEQSLKNAKDRLSVAIGQAGYDLNQNQNRKPVSVRLIGALRKTLPRFKLTPDELSKLILQNKDALHFGNSRDSNRLEPKLKISRLKNGVDRLFKKEIIQAPEFLSGPDTEAIIKGMWNFVHSDDFKDSKKLEELAQVIAKAKGMDQEDNQVTRELEELKGRTVTREYKDFYQIIANRENAFSFIPGHPVIKKEFEKLKTYLSKYPEWNHPVGKGHNPDRTGDDNYIENSLSKMMQNMRLRWDELDRIKQDNMGQYVDMLRKIAKLWDELIQANSLDAQADNIDDLLPDLKGTDHENRADGYEYFGLERRTRASINDLLDQIVRGEMDNDDPFDGSMAGRLKDVTQNYLRGSFDAYYRNIDRHGSKFYKIGGLPELIKDRVSAIKQFLTGFDKLSQSVGFSSQADDIAQKKVLHKKQKTFMKKHGASHIAEVPGFSFGGDILINNEVIQKLKDDDLGQYDVKEYFSWSRSNYVSQYDGAILIPTSHYFMMQEAEKVLAEPYRQKNPTSWRISKATVIKRKFDSIYRTDFETLKAKFSNINAVFGQGKTIKDALQEVGVKFTEENGDGREGMKGLGDDPILPREDINGPYGEPFEFSSSAAWHANNPELSKKAKALEKQLAKDHNSVESLIRAGGVEGMEGAASADVADKTNWTNLADYLKIERGVNDQGVNLLKKVYNQYDSDHNWRPENPEAIGTERWAAAVKMAYDYIKKHYTVSGGNYFRDGDDVSSVHSKPSSNNQSGSNTTTEADYEKVRSEYIDFERMMNSGMQNYILRPDVNKLVDFLTNPDNDEDFKKAVLQSMMREKLAGEEPNDFQGHLARGRQFYANQQQRAERDRVSMLSRESVFDKFDKLSLEEQIQILENSKVLERPLTKDEKKDKEKYVKGMKKNKGDFEKRYGKDAKAVMYATATKMAKESVNDFNKIEIINKLLADHFPVGDLKKQMLAFQAIPIPAMLDSFRNLRAEAGDDACARNILRFYVSALPEEVKSKVKLNESILSEAPAQLVSDFRTQVVRHAILQRDIQQACLQPKLKDKCNTLNVELKKLELKIDQLEKELMSYTAREVDIDTAIKMGGEQREIDMRKAKTQLKKQVVALVKKAEGIADDKYEASNFNKVQNSIADKLNSIISGIEEDEKVSLVALGKLLTHAMNGELIDTKALVSAKEGKIDDHINRNLDKEVLDIFDSYFKGDIFEFIPGGTTSGNYGPAEVGLAIFGNPAKKAESHGDLEIDGVMYELKGSGFKRLKSGKVGNSIYGARLNSKGISSGTNGWGPLEKGIKKIHPKIGELNPNKNPSEAAKEPGFMKYTSAAGKQASRYNFNAKGIQFLNDEVLEPYSDKKKTTELLLGVIKGIMPGWKRVPDFEKIVAKMPNEDGTLSMQRLWSFYTGLAYESYNIEDNVENILFINSNTRSYYIINNRDEMIKAIAQGKVEVTGGISWNDDQMKASPQYAIR